MDVESVLRAIGTSHGYAEIKDKQRDAMSAFVSGKNVFVSLSTGYGKSFCYQCFPLLFDTLQSHELPTSIVVLVDKQARYSSHSDQECTFVYMPQTTPRMCLVRHITHNRVYHARDGGTDLWNVNFQVFLINTHQKSVTSRIPRRHGPYTRLSRPLPLFL